MDSAKQRHGLIGLKVATPIQLKNISLKPYDVNQDCENKSNIRGQSKAFRNSKLLKGDCVANTEENLNTRTHM